MTRLRTGAYLAPNRARNLAAAHVRTPYVVFVDNDVLVAPGWLEALVDCADATSAWAVGPLCQQGPWRAGEVHLAGGEARIEGEAGARRLVERQAHLGARVADVRPSLVRRATELVEFHAVLVRRDALAALGGLDEDLRSVGEHTDFCLRVREAGGGIWFEPGAAVTYLRPDRLMAADLEFYVVRWSPAWNRRSRERFAARWGLPVTDPRIAHTASFADDHRRLWAKPWSFGRLLGKGARRTLRRALDAVLSPWLLARARGRGTGQGWGRRGPVRGTPTPCWVREARSRRSPERWLRRGFRRRAAGLRRGRLRVRRRWLRGDRGVGAGGVGAGGGEATVGRGGGAGVGFADSGVCGGGCYPHPRYRRSPIAQLVERQTVNL